MRKRKEKKKGNEITSFENYDGLKLVKKNKLTPDQVNKGSLEGRIPVMLDNRTIIYILPGQDIEEIKNRYENRHLIV